MRKRQMDPNKENSKSWKRVGIFNTYEAALSKKEEILYEFPEHTLVKIKRYGQGHNKFQVKCWHPEPVKPAKTKKRKKK